MHAKGPMNVLIVDDHPMVVEYLSAAVAKALPEAVLRTAGTLAMGLEIAIMEAFAFLLALSLPCWPPIVFLVFAIGRRQFSLLSILSLVTIEALCHSPIEMSPVSHR